MDRVTTADTADRRRDFPGATAFPATPMGDDGSIRYDVLRRVLDEALEAGVTAVAPGSTTGEGPFLSQDEKRDLLVATVEHVGGRAGVVASVGSMTTGEAVRIAEAAERAGASALLVTLPQFFPLTEAEVRGHFTAVAGATSLPVILYNQALARTELPPRLVVDLAMESSNIAGIKEASGKTTRIAELVATCPADFAVYCGSGHLALQGLLAGARGWFTGFTNVDSETCVRFCEAARTGDWELARRLYELTVPLSRVLYDRRPIAVSMKRALVERGYAAGVPRAPLHGLSDADRSLLGQLMDDFVVAKQRVLPVDESPSPSNRDREN